MAFTKISLVNFTVFEELDIELGGGVNVFIGENGTGKTHLMKLLYAASQAARKEVDFANKIAMLFRPDNFSLGRLVRRKVGDLSAKIRIHADNGSIGVEFSRRCKRWDANISNAENWERIAADLVATFIPSKEILSNSWNLGSAVARSNIEFDDTYIDVISAALVNVSPGTNNNDRAGLLRILEKAMSGKVTVVNEHFYLMPNNQSKLEFQLVSEGMRKIALLWLLIKNGALENGTVLFWDEPEANINPSIIPVLVDLILELQTRGVQIFISTHDYILAKYIEVKQKEKHDVRFHSLYKTDSGVKCESEKNFRELKNNVIISSFDKLLDEVYFEHVED